MLDVLATECTGISPLGSIKFLNHNLKRNIISSAMPHVNWKSVYFPSYCFFRLRAVIASFS